MKVNTKFLVAVVLVMVIGTVLYVGLPKYVKHQQQNSVNSRQVF